MSSKKNMSSATLNSIELSKPIKKGTFMLLSSFVIYML